jgi:hypothetical protein
MSAQKSSIPNLRMTISLVFDAEDQIEGFRVEGSRLRVSG